MTDNLTLNFGNFSCSILSFREDGGLSCIVLIFWRIVFILKLGPNYLFRMYCFLNKFDWSFKNCAVIFLKRTIVILAVKRIFNVSHISSKKIACPLFLNIFLHWTVIQFWLFHYSVYLTRFYWKTIFFTQSYRRLFFLIHVCFVKLFKMISLCSTKYISVARWNVLWS